MEENNKESISEDVEEFLQRLRCKVASPLHKFKKTDRLNVQSRFPEFQEETEEEKKANVVKKVEIKDVVSRGYDVEILEKLQAFLEFLKNIFKKDKPA
ncbi:MAG: hypothetical protein HUU50_11295 [Candidatus Brocadiae bacterium]|nr:hypothetical protein [Candidatus Brocadiia bacterium]